MAESTMQTMNAVTREMTVEAMTANQIVKEKEVFTDLIHGKIELHPVCCLIIDTPQFQRLRYIKQMGSCYLVYPGACHNRFEHSLGVCYLAGKIMKTIRNQRPGENINDKDILCVEIAGLCHDLGQGPFSRVFEMSFMPKIKSKPSEKFTHQKIARKMFEFMLETEKGRLKKDIKKILEDCGMPDFDDYDYEFICEMIDDPKDLEKPEWPYKGRSEDKSYMYEIVANRRNGIDVDKWDYLVRDSYMLGMKVNVDYAWYFTSARVIKCNGRKDRRNTKTPSRKQICFIDDAAEDIYDMCYTMMRLHTQVYQHKTHKSIELIYKESITWISKT